MGGAGYIFTGEHDASLMHNSATINLNIPDTCHKGSVKKIFYPNPAKPEPNRVR
jgi:hypothetical protein